MASGDELPAGVRVVGERDGASPPWLRVHPEWDAAFPWLVQGTTAGGRPSLDVGLFGDTPVPEVHGRWRALREGTGMATAVHSLQVHDAEVLEHDSAVPGLLLTEGWDGHVTSRPGILLTVSVADCVPVSLVEPDARRVALLHGGWRGTAAGIVGRGLRRLGGEAASVHAHLGPAICGACYEVGPEVHEALGQPPPTDNAPIDLRAVQAHQLIEAGVAPERITVSAHCTRCGTGFFSHRAGDAGRQLGVLGIR